MHYKIHLRIINLFICIIFLTTSCHKSVDNTARLNSILQLAETNATAAKDSLKLVDSTCLSEYDLNLYNLITIRIADKLYVRHTNDSLIRSVIKFFDKHSDDPIHIMTLYYGGRVYSDMGDYPTALRYFQQALDKLPEDTEQYQFKCHILSQTGRLLSNLQLNNQALIYLKEVLALESIKIRQDSINQLYNNQLVGLIYLDMDSFNTAEKYFRVAKEFATESTKNEKILEDVYIAAAKFKKGQIDSAVSIIKDKPHLIADEYKDIANCYAANIYLTSKLYDSAYNYAVKIINDSLSENKDVGYSVLLSLPDIGQRVSSDSLLKCATDYHALLKNYTNHNEERNAVIQNTLYNYDVHDRQKVKALKAGIRLERIVYTISFTVFILLISVFYYRLKNKEYRLQLNKTLNDLQKLRQKILSSDEYHSSTCALTTDNGQSIKNMQQQLRSEIKSILANCDSSIKIHNDILKSEPYKTIQHLISEDRIIVENNPLWNELETIVLSVSPAFKENLTLLFGASLKTQDYHLALLIKCGIKPSNICILLGKVKGTISSTRKNLGYKLFEENLSAKDVDIIIRNL